jgi:hypothetical protein
VHDSGGLAISNGKGEQLWRPLTIRLQVSTFTDLNPRARAEEKTQAKACNHCLNHQYTGEKIMSKQLIATIVCAACLVTTTAEAKTPYDGSWSDRLSSLSRSDR